MCAPAFDIVGLGMATLDVLVRLNEMPTWEAGARIEDFALDGGGPVGTACAAAARLGARVGFVGVAGNDLVGELKLRSLREHGVDTSRVVIRSRPETQVVVVYVNERTGERVFSGLREFARDPLSVDELDRDYVTSARWVHLDGSHPQAALVAAQWAKECARDVSLDCAETRASSVGPGVIDLLQLVDVLICGHGFGRALTKYEDPWAAGEAALTFGPSIVVQTHGARGSYTVTRHERFHTPAFSVQVVDTTGAGDVFHGAYLVGLLRGWPLEVVAQFASAVAAMKCTRLGGRRGIPTLDEVLSFLRDRGIAVE